VQAGGVDIHPSHPFTFTWQGIAACTAGGVGTILGVLLVLIRNLTIRRTITTLSLLFSVAMVGSCASFVAIMPWKDPAFQIIDRNATVYGGLGLGIHLAQGAALAWLFAALSAWTWKKPHKI
jgi:hypothetical protein